MNETELTETIDRRGQHEAARGPGVYALAVDAPDTVARTTREWLNTRDATPPNDALARIAKSETTLYVGAAGEMYARLCDHVAGDVRRAAFLSVFPPTALHSLWPTDDADRAFEREFSIAARLADPETRVWTDGELL